MLYYVMLLSFHHFMLCSVVSCKGGFSYYAVVISFEGVRCIIIIFGATLTSSFIFEEKIAFWYSQVLKAVECFGGSSGFCKVKDVLIILVETWLSCVLFVLLIMGQNQMLCIQNIPYLKTELRGGGVNLLRHIL